MKVGDLVALRLCHQAGKIGMITCVPKQSYVAKKNPQLAIYWILVDERNQCYTGNQLIRHKWMEK